MIKLEGLIKRLETSKDGNTDCLIDVDKDLEYMKQWTTDHKEDIQPFRQACYEIKNMDKFAKEKTKTELKKQLYVQQRSQEKIPKTHAWVFTSLHFE